MQESQKLVDKIQRRDRIQRYISTVFLVLIIVIQALTTIYILNRIDAFERSIDCKLLILPADRSKAKLVECSEINSPKLIEKPSDKKPKTLDQKSSAIVPTPITSFEPIKATKITEHVINLPRPVQEPIIKINVPNIPDSLNKVQDIIKL